jgi:serine phosphatase RsbU (regulator of sigma subunit)/Tfp pilus assembly protein PilF
LNVDSLWGVYNDEQKTDSVRLMAMWFIAYDCYLFNNPDSSYLLAQQMYDFAVETDEKQFQAHALATQGNACYYLGKHDLAIEYHERALKIHQKLNNQGSAASAYNNIANVYRDRGQLADAIDYYVLALKVHEKIGNKQAISTVLGNLGAVYADMQDYANSRIWYNRALEVKRDTDDKLGLSLLLSGIGTRYLNEGIYDSAMYYQKEALKIRIAIDNKNGIAHSHNHIGQVFSAMEFLDSAMIHFRRSLSTFEKLNMESGVTDVCHSIAEVYEKQGDYELAMDYAKRALEVANQGGYVDAQRDVSYMLFKLYKRKGNYASALAMHENYMRMRDSIDREANQEAIIEQGFRYDYEKKSIADSLSRVEEKNLGDLKHKKETEKQQIMIVAITGGLILVIGFLIFVFNRLRVTKKQKVVIEEQKEVVELAHHELEEKNKEIMDSITYAKRIQSAILPPDKVVKVYLQESFILYKPKDIVAGDFYWMEHRDDKVLFAAADCTGHGVPGAMVSVVCNNALNRSVREHGLTDPGQILDKSREIVIQEFEKSDEEVKDGMDIALCSLDGNKLQYAGANNPLWIIRNGELIETKANKQPIGKFDNQLAYTTHTFELQAGDALFIFSDGYVDQFGGEDLPNGKKGGKKFKARAFKELLLSIQDKPMEQQKIILDDTFEKWKGNLEQLDDVCVIGVKV